MAEFESDFLANKKSLERLETSGKEMIDEDHFATGEISRMIDELKVRVKNVLIYCAVVLFGGMFASHRRCKRV